MAESTAVALLDRAREGSPAALSQLVERFSPRLLAVIRLRLGPSLRAHLESRDVLQETWLKALAHLPGFAGAGAAPFMGWLAQIAANEIRDRADYHGRQRRDGAREERMEPAALDGLAARVRSETSRLALSVEMSRLERALESLSPDHREVILLRKLEERPFREVGERMGRSPDACRVLLARALATLAMAMEEGAR
jgi:RNA polymerase sigma-70 factor (ECF subfamily)